MADLSDAFIALPGGLGTLEELAEVTSWAQLGLHAKPIGLLDVGDYWDAAAGVARSGGRRAGSSRRTIAGCCDRATDLDDLLARFEAWSPPAGRWEPRR